MKQLAKRILSLTLALAVCMSAMCLSALAVDELSSLDTLLETHGDSIVTELTEEEKAVTNYAIFDLAGFSGEISDLSQLLNTTKPLGETPSLVTGVKFKAPFGLEDALGYECRYWNADFVVSVDRDVPSGSVYLFGNYGSYGWIGFTSPYTVAANTPIRLLSMVGIPVNFTELCQLVQEFSCGAYVDESVEGFDPATKITITLNFYETTRDDRPVKAEKDPAVVHEVYTGTFPLVYRSASFISDGEILQTNRVAYGETLEYTGATPTKASDGTYTYTFTGWAPEIDAVTANTNYIAQFSRTPIETAGANTETTNNGDGTTTTKVTTGDNSYVETTKDSEGNVTKVEEKSGVTTTTTEYTTETETVTNGTKVTDTAKKTVKTDGIANKVTTTTTETTTTTTTEEETQTTTYQVETTTTTKEKVGDADETSKGSITTTQEVNLKSEEQEDGTKVSDALPESTVKETVTAAAEKANNTIAVAQVDVSKIAEAELEKIEDAEKKNVTVDVALTLKTTLDSYATATDETTNVVKVASVTYDVTPYMTTTVKVDGVELGEATTTKVSNDYLAESVKTASSDEAKIKFRLPVPDSFVTEGVTQLTVRHIHDDGTADNTTGTIGGVSGNYYVTVAVKEFSKFEVLPAGSTFYTVTFDANGGSAVDTQHIASGATAARPAAPTRSGYTFNRWTLNGSAYDFTAAVNSDITLTAQWTQNSSGAPSGSGGYTPAPAVTITDEETPLSEFPIFYVDVAENTWYHDAVAYVTGLGLMEGVGDNRFSPNASTTRGMVAVVMMRLANGEAVDLDSFFDVASDAYYAEAAAWAVENGVYVGFDDGSFRGEINITREQFAAVLYRYAKAKGFDVSGRANIEAYADGDKVSFYARDAVAWTVESGIIEGVGSNLLDPTGKATRAQLATMLMRFHEMTTAKA